MIQQYIKGDLALGFEQGFIKVYDLSEHFQSTKVDEVNQMGVNSRNLNMLKRMMMNSQNGSNSSSL